MKVGVSTFYGMNKLSVVECVKQLKESGVKTIELMYESKLEVPINKKNIAELKSFNLDYSMHGPFLGQVFAHPNNIYGNFYLGLVRDALECAASVGCKEFVMHGGKLPSSFMKVESGDSREYFVDLFIGRYGKLFERYDKKGVKVLVENLHEGEIGGEVGDFLQIKKALPFVGFCFDIAHAANTNSVNRFISEFGSSIGYVHATDNDLRSDQHLALGKGKIDFRGVFKRLKGFDGKVIVECLKFDDCMSSKEYLLRLNS